MMQAAIKNKPVVGIFGSSISTALNLILPDSKFGIVTTGNCWTALLSAGVRRYLGTGERNSDTFGGVLATGISASDLSASSADIARAKVFRATRDLVRGGDISVVCS
jgi:Asp/Glu/hydantoin racemase